MGSSLVLGEAGIDASGRDWLSSLYCPRQAGQSAKKHHTASARLSTRYAAATSKIHLTPSSVLRNNQLFAIRQSGVIPARVEHKVS